MANEFVARRGIIVPAAGANITGSVLVSGSINASGYSITAASFTGSFSGSIGTAVSASYVSPSGLPAGTVSSSTQVVWSQVAYNAGIVSSSAQVQPLLPGGTVSSSTQVQANLPGGTVSSSAQYPGWVTASSQIDVRQTTGIATLATTGSNTFVGNQIISGSLTTTADTMNFSGAMTVSGSLIVTGSITNTTGGFTGSFSGSINNAVTASYVNPSGLPAGTVSASSQVVWSQVAYNTGIVSSSAQVQPLLPGGTISSSAQYPGWVTSSAQVNTGSFTGSFIGSVTGAILANNNVVSSSTQVAAFLPGGTVSSSTQVQANLPAGTVSSSAQYPGWVTASSQVVWSQVAYNTGIVSSSTQVQPLLPGGTVSSSAQYPGWVTSSAQVNTGSFTGSFIGSHTGSILAAGVVSASSQYPGWVTASSQIVWSQVNYNAGIVSSSAQVQPLLPGGTVSSSAQYPGWVTSSVQVNSGSFTGSFNGTLTSTVANGAPSVTNTTNGSGLVLQGTGNSQTAQLRIVANGGGWLDNINTAYFQISSSTGNNAAFMGGTYSADATFDRLQFNSKYTQFSNNVFGTTPTPTYVFQALNLTSSAVPVFGIFGASGQSGNYLDVTTSGSTAGNIFTITGTGKVGIGTPTPVATLQIQGNVSASSFTGSILANNGVVSSSGQVIALLPTNTVSSSAQVTAFLPVGTVSSSAQYPGWVTSSTQVVWSQVAYNTGIVSSSTQVAPLLPGGTVSSSTQVTSYLPTGTISSSTQFTSLTAPFTGSFTGSFTGDGSNLTGIATNLYISGSTSGNSSINLKTQPLIISGANGITATVSSNTLTLAAPAGTLSSSGQVVWSSVNYNTGIVSSSTQVQPLLPGGTVSSSAQYPGWMTASSQVVWSSVNYNAGIVSSSAQTVANIAGQTIAPAVINATGAISGASIQVSGNGTVGGNLTVTGTLTATSQSVQYVTSSQFNVSTNRIIVNTNQSLQFGGISVIDSGSTGNSGSLYWDSVNNRWLYENVSGQAPYNSAILINGPINYGATGQERGLNVGRVPVAVGDDHIDTAPQSSSVRIDFATGRTDIEKGLFVTGSLTANGTVTLAGIPSSSTQVQALLPGGTVSSSAQYPGWVTSSAQVNTGSFTGSFIGAFTGSILANNNVVSSSAQVTAFLPAGTLSSSTQVVWSSVNYNSGIVSSSAQVAPLLPGGTVSSSAQYPGWVTASSQIQLASITGTSFASSNFTFPQGVTVTGLLTASTSAYVNNTLYSGSTVTGIVGPVSNQVVAAIVTGSYNSAHFDYIINDGTNYRAGTVITVWSPSSVEFTETSTNDLGNTSQATFVVDVVSGVARLKFSNTSGTWTVKTGVRAI